MATVLLGNTAVTVPVPGAQAQVNGDSPVVEDRSDLGQQITTVCPPTEVETVDEQVQAVADAWRAWSAAAPAWVESDDEVLEAAVAAHFGCPVGCPDNGNPDVHNHQTWVEG